MLIIINGNQEMRIMEGAIVSDIVQSVLLRFTLKWDIQSLRKYSITISQILFH